MKTCLCALLFFSVSLAASSEDWPRFRGPNGSGLGGETAVPFEFGPDRNVVWKTPLPPGHSSPVVAGDRVFVTGLEDGALVTLALDRATGRVIWKTGVKRAREQPADKRNNAASPTPATDGRNVFVFFQDFGLLAYDEQGRERWRVPLGPFSNAYGMGASPIVVGDLVVLVCDQSVGSFMLAVGKNDGKERWKVDRSDMTSGHSTPVVFAPKGGPTQLLVAGSFYLVSYEARTGRKLWWSGGLGFEMKATPVHDGSTVYISGPNTSFFTDSYNRNIPSFEEVRSADKNGDGRFSADEVPDELARKWMKLLDLDGDTFIDAMEWKRFQTARRNPGGLWAFRMGGAGDLTGTNTVWHYEKAVPQLPSPLLYRKVLYLVNDGGIVTAFNASTGDVLAQLRIPDAAESYYASPVAVAGKILVISDAGKASVLEMVDGTLKVRTTNNLDEPVSATPAVAGGRLYIRTGSALYCFGETANKSRPTQSVAATWPR